ncbi:MULTISPECIES: hypothetical protein [unclassified Fibrobacter]|uniref:hypothetical protein n=1 Tax=unclassified Fibrobacter TaxID=2634177 RepID=UPI000D6C241A|nr:MULTISPECIES: hypothetical protein [unclassified Fibrobacter]PWJ61474.1 hypothetical protein BGX12_1275 [Fibrobacter sp. UWR4]PZW67290.1 hypothetical protein C8E88_10275 [Fibrobacter sp. UWR1]
MSYKQNFTFIGMLALIAGLIACGGNDNSASPNSTQNSQSSNSQTSWEARPCDKTVIDTIRHQITVYTDTMYDTTETSQQYISFVYEKDSLGTLDTLTTDTVSTKCYFDGDKVTSCNSFRFLTTYPDLGLQPVVVVYNYPQLTPIDTCDTCPKICYDQEFLYDTTYTTKTIHTNIIHRDTIFVNYGENALATNVIPYKAEAPKADTSAIREKFKEIPADTTLNVQVYGTLTFEGLPKSAFANPLPIIGITTSFPINHYPISVPTPKIYSFSNGFHPENDTTITWNLIISQDDTKDTLAITSIFKK